MIKIPTEQQSKSYIETLKRSISRLHQKRNQVYAAHLAPLDERISKAEGRLRRLEQPERYCRKCGERCNIGTKCPTESCENYSGVPF